MKLKWIILAGLLVLSYLSAWLPVMKVHDGCACGYRRTWYELPESPFHDRKWALQVEAEGDPAHAHNVWDPQWGVWFGLPWEK